MTTAPRAIAALPPLAPHVRLRWRQRLGLAPDLVVDTAALAPADVETALAVAAAAVVDGAHLRLALALGCPAVTEPAAAAALRAVDGDHVVVGGRSDAVALAADPVRAARLSHRGRVLVEGAADPPTLDGWTRHAQVSVQSSRADPGAAVVVALDELGTAPSAPIRARAAAALEGFGPPGPGSAVTPSARHPSIDAAAVVRLGGRDTAPPASGVGAALRRLAARARRIAGRLRRRIRLNFGR